MPGAVLVPISDLDAFVATRESLHALAEHVLAPARHRVAGRIGLRAIDGGFGTPPFGDGPETIRVVGTNLVVTHGTEERVVPITTIGAAAAAVGITPGAPTGVYTPVLALEPDRPLAVDPAAADVLAHWYAFGTEALETLRAEADASDAPSEIQLWPEHFDLGLDLGDETRGARGIFGASPGDTYHPEPYLYAMHWVDVPDDPYWNDRAFGGASCLYPDLLAASDPLDAGLAFFRRGRDVLASGAT